MFNLPDVFSSSLLPVALFVAVCLFASPTSAEDVWGAATEPSHSVHPRSAPRAFSQAAVAESKPVVSLCTPAAWTRSGRAVSVAHAVQYYAHLYPDLTFQVRPLLVDATEATGPVGGIAHGWLAYADRCDTYIGPGFSSAALPLGPFMVTVPWMEYAATSEELSDTSRFPFLSRVIPADSASAKFGVDFMLGHIGWKSIGIVYSNEPYGRSIGDAVDRRVAELGGTVERRVSVSAGGSKSDFVAAAQRIAQLNTNVIYLAVTFQQDSRLFYDAIVEACPTCIFFSSESGCSSSHSEMLNHDGILCATYEMPDQSHPVLADYLNTWRTLWGTFPQDVINTTSSRVQFEKNDLYSATIHDATHLVMAHFANIFAANASGVAVSPVSATTTSRKSTHTSGMPAQQADQPTAPTPAALSSATSIVVPERDPPNPWTAAWKRLPLADHMRLLRSINVEGLTGSLQLLSDGERKHIPRGVVTTTRGGNFVPIATLSSTASPPSSSSSAATAAAAASSESTSTAAENEVLGLLTVNALNATAVDYLRTLRWQKVAPAGSDGPAENTGLSATTVALLAALPTVVVIGMTATLVVLFVYMCGARLKQRHAPTDPREEFALAFTDVESSTSLWATDPAAMSHALGVHHDTIRHLIKLHNGYEVKSVGDGFMVAFRKAEDAVLFAKDTQGALHNAHWGPDIGVLEETYREAWAMKLMNKDISIGTSMVADVSPSKVAKAMRNAAAWRGLRVRVGVHFGAGQIVHDAVTERYDYYGTVVNAAARVCDLAHGGQVLATAGALEAAGLPDVVDDLRSSAAVDQFGASKNETANVNACDSLSPKSAASEFDGRGSRGKSDDFHSPTSEHSGHKRSWSKGRVGRVSVCHSVESTGAGVGLGGLGLKVGGGAAPLGGTVEQRYLQHAHQQQCEHQLATDGKANNAGGSSNHEQEGDSSTPGQPEALTFPVIDLLRSSLRGSGPDAARSHRRGSAMNLGYHQLRGLQGEDFEVFQLKTSPALDRIRRFPALRGASTGDAAFGGGEFDEDESLSVCSGPAPVDQYNQRSPGQNQNWMPQENPRHDRRGTPTSNLQNVHTPHDDQHKLLHHQHHRSSSASPRFSPSPVSGGVNTGNTTNTTAPPQHCHQQSSLQRFGAIVAVGEEELPVLSPASASGTVGTVGTVGTGTDSRQPSTVGFPPITSSKSPCRQRSVAEPTSTTSPAGVHAEDLALLEHLAAPPRNTSAKSPRNRSPRARKTINSTEIDGGEESEGSAGSLSRATSGDSAPMSAGGIDSLSPRGLSAPGGGRGGGRSGASASPGAALSFPAMVATPDEHNSPYQQHNGPHDATRSRSGIGILSGNLSHGIGGIAGGGGGGGVHGAVNANSGGPEMNVDVIVGVSLETLCRPLTQSELRTLHGVLAQRWHVSNGPDIMSAVAQRLSLIVRTQILQQQQHQHQHGQPMAHSGLPPSATPSRSVGVVSALVHNFQSQYSQHSDRGSDTGSAGAGRAGIPHANASTSSAVRYPILRGAESRQSTGGVRGPNGTNAPALALPPPPRNASPGLPTALPSQVEEPRP